MKNVHKSVLIWYSAEEMFRLVADVPNYPAFLPWCDHAAELTREGNVTTAEIGIAFSGIKQIFVTQNTEVPGRELHMRLVKGPFSNLDGDWKFTPVGDASERACRVELNLNYGFASATLSKVVGPVFDKIANTLVDAFIQRAEQVYGEA